MTSLPARTRTPLGADAHQRSPLPLAQPAAPVFSDALPRRGADITSVVVDPASFWGLRQTTNAAATLAHCEVWMERLGWLDNFDRVARGESLAQRSGWQFSDSETYKLLEAMAWELARRPDAELDARYRALVTRIGSAQDEDGYLNTAFGHRGVPPRYSDFSMGHELYCAGHLLQAAVARLRTAGEDELTGIARRVADHVCAEFGDGGLEEICGHPEIEVALVEFGRATGERRYIDQARLFVERRGRGSLTPPALLSAAYFQDDTPVRDAEVLRGHAVRALYLSAGAADVALEHGDDDLLDAVTRQWERTVGRRTYVTGGMGSRHQDEGFGDDFELPPDRAYCETCAGVASIMLAWRLYLATGDVRYPDLIERTLFNIVATSARADGRAFFYANTLHKRAGGTEAENTDEISMRAESGLRAPWFDVSCCPTNVARTYASLGAYTAALDGDALVIMQFAQGTIAVDGFAVTVATRYPDDGVVTLTIDSAPEGTSTIRLRVPSWAEGAVLSHADRERPVSPGWVDVTAEFAGGETIELRVPTAPRLTWPDPRIDAVRGAVAVERGPLVLCAESVDLPAGVELDDVRIDPSSPLVACGDGARVSGRSVSQPHMDFPYSTAQLGSPVVSQHEVTLVPYHRWAERGSSTMRVFLPVAAE